MGLGLGFLVAGLLLLANRFNGPQPWKDVALKDLEECQVATAQLGKPIKIPSFTLNEWLGSLKIGTGPRNWAIRVAGPKASGILFFTGMQQDNQKLLSQATLQVGHRNIDVMRCNWRDE